MNSNLFSALNIALLLVLAVTTLLPAHARQQQQFAYTYALAGGTGEASMRLAARTGKDPGPQQNNPSQTLSDVESEASCAPAFASEVSKVIERNYKVSKTDVLNIENKFGKVHINTWKKNEIHVKVVIICRASTDQMAQQLLDKIKIAESRSGNYIRYKTEMQPMRNNNTNKQSFEINYTVSMPEDNEITVLNSFGDVYVSDFNGKTDVTVKYGSLKSEQFNNTSNTIKVAYGSANCRYINQGNIDLSYGSMQVEKTNGLKVTSKYSDFKIGSLSNTLDLNLKYGSLKVDNISRNINKINVESGFSPIALRFEDNTTFNFDVNVQYGNFRFDKDQVNLTSLEKNNTSAAYKGNFGNASSKGSISIVSKYGDVRFTK